MNVPDMTAFILRQIHFNQSHPEMLNIRMNKEGIIEIIDCGKWIPVTTEAELLDAKNVICGEIEELARKNSQDLPDEKLYELKNKIAEYQYKNQESTKDYNKVISSCSSEIKYIDSVELKSALF